MTQDIQVQSSKLTLKLNLNKLVVFIFLSVIAYFSYDKYALHRGEQVETSKFILTPQVNDIYFLDARLLNETLINDIVVTGALESKHKYKLAKVLRVTDDNLVVVYGKVFYQWKNSVVNSIQYGDLNNDYFRLIPNYIPLSEIQEMGSTGAVYLIKRPNKNKLYGSFIGLN